MLHARARTHTHTHTHTHTRARARKERNFSLLGGPSEIHREPRGKLQSFVLNQAMHVFSTVARRVKQSYDTHIGRFIMFSWNTNTYNKKTQRTHLNAIVYSHRKPKKFFFYN
jgi:hypothetical protein